MDSKEIKRHVAANDLRVGSHVVIEDRPYKILGLTRAQPGKHGHCKTMLRAEDLFNGKKRDTVVQSGNSLPEPNIIKTNYDVLSIENDNYISVYDAKTQKTCDIKIVDNDLMKDISQKLENLDDQQILSITVIEYMDEIKVIDHKVCTDKQ